MVLMIILLVISVAILVFGAILSMTAIGDLYRLGVFYFVFGIISTFGYCYCYLCFKIGDPTTDATSTEEHVVLSEDSIPAIYDVNGNLIEQYVDEYGGN